MAGAFGNSMCGVVYIIPVCGIVANYVASQKYALEVELLVLCLVRVVQHPLVQICSHLLVILLHFKYV